MADISRQEQEGAALVAIRYVSVVKLEVAQRFAASYCTLTPQKKRTWHWKGHPFSTEMLPCRGCSRALESRMATN